MLTRAQSWGDQYYALLELLMDDREAIAGAVEIAKNARTGVRVRTLRGGASFKIDVRRGIPVPGNRRYYPGSAAAETAWQLMGTKDPEFIVRNAPKLWSKFVEDGELKAAYGYRWRQHFGRDQLMRAIMTLEQDPTNRQCWVQAWDPASDGCGSPNQPKNIPCPIGFSLCVSDETLHMSAFIRSSDVFVGLPYDVMNHTMLMHAIASTMGIEVGTLHVTLANAHIYEPHWRAASKCLNQTWYQETLSELVLITPIGGILSEPQLYVDQWKAMRTEALWDPLPELVL